MQTRHLSIVATINLGIMLFLTAWQIQRALHKYELMQRKPQAPLDEKNLRTQTNDQQIRSITISPRLDQKHYFIIGPAFKNHITGVELLGITRSPYTKHPIIMHLGWFPNAVAADSGLKQASHQASIHGLLYTPKGQLLRQTPQQNNWPKKLSYVDLNVISQALKTPVYPKIIVTNGSHLYDNLNNQNTLALGISRHICYALQFTAFGIIGFYWSHLIKRKKNAPT